MVPQNPANLILRFRWESVSWLREPTTLHATITAVPRSPTLPRASKPDKAARGFSIDAYASFVALCVCVCPAYRWSGSKEKFQNDCYRTFPSPSSNLMEARRPKASDRREDWTKIHSQCRLPARTSHRFREDEDSVVSPRRELLESSSLESSSWESWRMNSGRPYFSSRVKRTRALFREAV